MSRQGPGVRVHGATFEEGVTGAPQCGRVTPCAGTTPASGPPCHAQHTEAPALQLVQDYSGRVIPQEYSELRREGEWHERVHSTARVQT